MMFKDSKIFIDEHLTSRNLTRVIDDAEGVYTIPLIQTSRDLCIEMENNSFSRSCLFNDKYKYENALGKGEICFKNIHPGEYTLKINDSKYFPVGVGTIIAAIGDSITEGYNGHGFYRKNLNLNASDFPLETISEDGRNFPQYSPTAHIHRPEFNCMQSWMTELNNLLTEHFQHPVFIANEGWGGYDSGQYLKMVQEDQNWRNRIAGLAPNCWLIHLGVNDERHGLSAEQFYENMSKLINILKSDFNAKPETIYLAYTSYDYDGDMKLLDAYLIKIQELIEEHGINEGPDFYKAYSGNRDKWYDADPVHPNIPGMKYMAQLWAKTIIEQEKS